MRTTRVATGSVSFSAIDRLRSGRYAWRTRLRAALLILAATLTSACTDQLTQEAALVTSVTITASGTMLFSVGETAQLSAVARDARGIILPGKLFTWTSSDSTIVTVDATGCATATGPNGSATITASSEGISGTVVIAVATGPQGGTVVAAGGRVTLRVPAGALPGASIISVDPVTSFPYPEWVVGGAIFEFGPNGTQFANPVQLTIRYDAGRIPTGIAEGDLRLHQLVDGGWLELPGSNTDTLANTVSGPIHHFSTLALAPSQGAFAYPNRVTSTSEPLVYVMGGRTWYIYLGKASWLDESRPAPIAVTLACRPVMPNVVCTAAPSRPYRLFIGVFGSHTFSQPDTRRGFTDRTCTQNPSSTVTSSVLAHELAHAIQIMTGQTPPNPSDQQAVADWEAQAHCMGARITAICGPADEVTKALLDCVFSIGFFDPTFVQVSAGSATLSRGTTDSNAQLDGRIVFPSPRSMVRAEIPIFGLASGSEFESYRVEYGAGASPERWHVLVESKQPEHTARNLPELYTSADHAIRGNLATWDVGLTDYVYLPTYPRNHPVDLRGTHTVRLVVNGKNGSTVEDRVTVFVANLVSYASGGSASTGDDMVRLKVPEHALTQPFRLMGFEAVSDGPRAPVDRRVIGSIYVAREPGEAFSAAAELTMRLPALLPGDVSSARLSIFGYDAEQQRWQGLPTVRISDDGVLLTSIHRLHTYYAIMDAGVALPAIVNGSVNSAAAGAERLASADPYLTRQSFENDMGGWRNRGAEAGAVVQLDRAAGGRSALKLLNPRLGGSFGVSVLDQPFDASAYPIVEFAYRIAPEVKTDFYVKVSGRWYNIGFTDDANDFRNKRVNIAGIGRIDVRADGEWHTTRFDLWNMLRTQTRDRMVEQIVMADWDMAGMMRLHFGRNAAGATYWIDDFGIRRDDAARVRPTADVVIIDDFRGPGDRNRLDQPTSLFTDGNGGEIAALLEDDASLGHAIKLTYNVDRPGRFAGYVSQLPRLDVREYQLLRLTARGPSGLDDVFIGIRDAHGNESKVRLADFTTAELAGEAFHIGVPLVAFSPTIDWSDLVHVSFSVAAPSADHGDIAIGELRFERGLESVTIDRFDARVSRNLLDGEHAAFMSGDGLADTNVIQEDGNRALRIVYGGAIPWSHAGWRTELRGLDCSRCDVLRLRIRGAQGGEKPNLYLDDGNHRWPVDIEKYGTVTTAWQEIAIPLADFAAEGIDLTHLAALELVFEWEKMSGALFVDDIRFGPRTIATAK